MSKDNRYYLEKMQANVEFILEHMDGVSKTDLENDPVLLDSMMLRLVQISEDARNLSDAFREKNDQIQDLLCKGDDDPARQGQKAVGSL